MKKVILLGSGEHAVAVIDAIREKGDYEILGCISDDTDPARLVGGLPILGRESEIGSIDRHTISVAIGLGGWNDNRARKEIFERAQALDLDILTVVHPGAHIAGSATIGPGSAIFHGAYIGTETIIGQNVIIHVNSTVHHQTTIADHALVSSHVCIGANVKLEESVFLSIGSTVASQVTVGSGSLVAAGAVVLDDVAPGSRVAGTPAKVF